MACDGRHPQVIGETSDNNNKEGIVAMHMFRRLIVLVGAMLWLTSHAPAQNLFESDEGSGKINEFINTDGVLSTNPIVFASGASDPEGLAVNSAGDVFVSDTGGGTTINELVNTDGVLSTNPIVFASGLSRPEGLAFNGAGDLFEADEDSGKINEFINTDGVLSTNPTVFASGLNPPFYLAFNSAGDLFVGSLSDSAIAKFINTDGVLSTNPTVFASGLSRPEGLAFDSAGDLFEADEGSGKINVFINTDGVLSTNPTVFASGLNVPVGLAFDNAGDLFEAVQFSNKINAFINNDGVLSTNPTVFASGLAGPFALAFTPPGLLTIKKFQGKVNLNPSKSDADSYSLTAIPALPSDFSISNETVTVDVGGAESSFTLNAKGSSNSATNSCNFVLTKKTGAWTLTATAKKASLTTPWAAYGVTNATTAKDGVTVELPITVTVGTKTYATTDSLTYKATADKSGTLK